MCIRDSIIGKQKAVGNLTLGAERLTGTRRTQNQAVGVFQQLSIHHDEVVGHGTFYYILQLPEISGP